jgi:hypothetical protein
MGLRSRFKKAWQALQEEEETQPLAAPLPDPDPPVSPSTGRSSVPSASGDNFYEINKKLTIIKPTFNRDTIPVIRNLIKVNPDFGLALNNVVSLANTGIKIYLDTDVKPEVADQMRDHVHNKLLQWGRLNFTSPSGLIDKMFKQLMIGGAVATEWVVANDFSTVENIFFLKPEDIEFTYDKGKRLYLPYQRITNGIIPREWAKGDTLGELIKLNLYSFVYLGLPTDNEDPYGIPPYLTALEPLETEYKMLDNIKYIIEQLGIWGFLEVLMEKPNKQTGQSDKNYISEMESILDAAKARIQNGFRDGIAVGFKEDTEFNFHSSSKEGSGVRELYGMNWQRTIRGLKSDPALFGGDDSRSETQIAIVFTKMLSELGSYQNIIKANLEFGIRRELTLAGYTFKKLSVKFNASTLQDALKFEQAREVRIRNNNALYYDGIISQNDYAEDLGFDKPDQAKPRMVRNAKGGVDDPAQGAQKKQEREKKKDKSDRDVRKKSKPQDT